MGQHPVRDGEDRLLTVPNLITLTRLLCLPAFAVLLASGPGDWLAAAVLLGVLGVSDGLDGWVARRFHQVSRLGKVLDPVADRLLLAVAGLGTIAVGAVPLALAVAVLVREALVAGGSVTLALAGAPRIDVHRAGKAGTFALMVAFPLFLAGHSRVSGHAAAEAGGWVAGVTGALTGWYAAAGYVPSARTALAGRRGGGPGRGGLRRGDRRGAGAGR